ncbi:CHAT domain-containing protein [Phytohabitans rumicis]
MAATTKAAQEALRLAEDDPDRALALAAAVVRQARAEGDPGAAAVAERAWGLAAFHREDLDTAMRHLRRAITLGRSAGSATLAAEARMTLAFALNQRGRPRQALREIDVAIEHLGRVEGARARAQRGAILHQLGRLDEALACYRAALPVLRRANDLLWIQRVVLNRGVLHGQRYEFAAAESDLSEAARLCERLDLGLSLGYVHANLGYVHGLRGDVPVALDFFHRAQERIGALHAQLGPLLTDRSELLLSVRLLPEAREAAEQAVAEFEREGRRLALPEVRLLLARVAFLEGDHPAAERQARLAVREFDRQQRREWAALARLIVVRSELAGERRPRVSLRRVEGVVDAVARSHWPVAAIDGRLLVARLALERGRLPEASAQLERASRPRATGPALLRARAWYATALARLTAGNARGAARALRAGMAVLDEHGAALGATDLRAYAAGHRAELSELGLRVAFQDGRPRAILEWAELGRASHLRQRPVRPPDDAALAADLAQLRATVIEIDKARPRRPPAGLLQRQVALERRIRDHSRFGRGEPGPATARHLAVRELGADLGDRALLEYVRYDGDLYAVTVVGGRLRLHRLGPVARVRDLVDRIPFGLRRLARRSGTVAGRSGALALVRHAARGLDDALLAPLTEVGDRAIVIVPTAPLHAVPWSILPSCAGRPLSVTPSAALWQVASHRAARTRGRVIVAAGPHLPGADREARAVAAIHGASALTGPAATVEAVTAAMDGADLAHLAAHGSAYAHNPLFSSLRFADGPLMVYDLERLARVPHTVVLAACDSGRSVVYPGDELLGLAATFLSLGAAALVASVLPVLDAETAPFMAGFHERLAGGDPPAAALAAVQRVAGDDEAMAVAAGFVCLGHSG